MKKVFIWLLVSSTFCLWLSLPTLLPIKFKIATREIVFAPKIHYGLDLQGGSHLLFLIDTKKISAIDAEAAANSIQSIVEKRVNPYGKEEPQILILKKNNQYRLSVDLPGLKNSQEAIKLIGKTAQLDFREYYTEEKKEGTVSVTIPKFRKTTLTGKYLKKASVTFNQNTGQPQIALKFNQKGKDLFAEITKKNLKKPLAIFLDNQILTAPVVQDEITTGEAVINGSFSLDEAKELVLSLNSGALPAPLILLEQKTLEPTLGQDNINKSVFAGLVGLGCLVVFMLVVYRKNGVLSIISLLLYAIYSLAIYKLVGIVLTLSGIAGFILSIGMALDSNILIYERIKEESRKHPGDHQTAVKNGFQSALSSIKDANINTLLVCFILFNPLNLEFLPQFGVVRGFSLTLALGVLMSLYTGVFVTKNILWQVYKVDKKQ